jgi:hypothetical protein
MTARLIIQSRCIRSFSRDIAEPREIFLIKMKQYLTMKLDNFLFDFVPIMSIIFRSARAI